jgi:hypothetical protein
LKTGLPDENPEKRTHAGPVCNVHLSVLHRRERFHTIVILAPDGIALHSRPQYLHGEGVN